MIDLWNRWKPGLGLLLGLVAGVLLGSWLGWPLSPKKNLVNTEIHASEIVHNAQTRTMGRVAGSSGQFKSISRFVPGKLQRVTKITLGNVTQNEIHEQVAVSDVGDGVGRVTVQAEGADVTGGQDISIALPRSDYRNAMALLWKASKEGDKPGLEYAMMRGRAVFGGGFYVNARTKVPDEVFFKAGVQW
jgi:hypothetical protein